jgi:hypothetical protein
MNIPAKGLDRSPAHEVFASTRINQPRRKSVTAERVLFGRILELGPPQSTETLDGKHGILFGMLVPVKAVGGVLTASGCICEHFNMVDDNQYGVWQVMCAEIAHEPDPRRALVRAR